MRVTKLEPHIMQPALDNTDVDLFLDDVDEASHNVQSVAAESDSERESPGDGIAHFMEFLNRRRKKTSKSKHSIALERYETQKLACQSSSEKEVAELAMFNKFV